MTPAPFVKIAVVQEGMKSVGLAVGAGGMSDDYFCRIAL